MTQQVQSPSMRSQLLFTLGLAVFLSILGFGASLSMEDPTLVIGAAYIAAYLALCNKYPTMALAVAFAGAVFQNDLSAGLGPFRFSFGEFNLVLAFFVYVFKWMTHVCDMKKGPFYKAAIMYMAVCLSSSLPNWSDACVTVFLQMTLYFFIAPIVYTNFVKKTETLTIALYLLIALCVFLSLYGLASGTFYILGLHKNGVGSSIACGTVVGTELFLVQKKQSVRRIMFLALVIMVGGLIFALSRGAWIGALCGYFVVIAARGKGKFVFQSVLVLVPLIAAFWVLLPEDKKDYATSFDPNRENISARYATIDQARNLFYANPVFGVGVGLRKSLDATNIFWVTLAESGVQGLITFGLIHWVTLVMIFRTQKFVARNDPRFSILVLGSALLILKMAHGLVDHYWSRGPIMIAWACCGMSTAVYIQEQERLKRLNIQIMKARRLRSRRVRTTGIGAPG